MADCTTLADHVWDRDPHPPWPVSQHPEEADTPCCVLCGTDYDEAREA